MNMRHILDVFPHPVGFPFKARAWEKMVWVQADKQLAGLPQFILIDQFRYGSDVGKVGVKGFKTTGISQQFAARVQVMLQEYSSRGISHERRK